MIKIEGMSKKQILISLIVIVLIVVYVSNKIIKDSQQNTDLINSANSAIAKANFNSAIKSYKELEKQDINNSRGYRIDIERLVEINKIHQSALKFIAANEYSTDESKKLIQTYNEYENEHIKNVDAETYMKYLNLSKIKIANKLYQIAKTNEGNNKLTINDYFALKTAMELNYGESKYEQLNSVISKKLTEKLITLAQISLKNKSYNKAYDSFTKALIVSPNNKLIEQQLAKIEPIIQAQVKKQNEILNSKESSACSVNTRASNVYYDCWSTLSFSEKMKFVENMLNSLILNGYTPMFNESKYVSWLDIYMYANKNENLAESLIASGWFK